MGWSSGNDIAIAVIDNFPVRVNKQDKVEFFKKFIDAMYMHDWDTDCELLGMDEEFDEALRQLNPDWDWDQMGD